MQQVIETDMCEIKHSGHISAIAQNKNKFKHFLLEMPQVPQVLYDLE